MTQPERPEPSNAAGGDPAAAEAAAEKRLEPHPEPALPVEVGGPQGPEPTRYGDWERKGRCIDF
jgi:hypothetical protein